MTTGTGGRGDGPYLSGGGVSGPGEVGDDDGDHDREGVEHLEGLSLRSKRTRFEFVLPGIVLAG
jgi:hypothetical protein